MTILPLAPAAQGKDPGSGNTVVPEPGMFRGLGDPLTPLIVVTGPPKQSHCNLCSYAFCSPFFVPDK